MSLNNHSSVNNGISSTRESERFHTEYIDVMSTLDRLGANHPMLSIIDTMNSQLNQLLTTGATNREDFHYKQLSSLLDQANKIQQKPVKSYEDTMGFYNSYNNFKDIKNRICGDENV